MVLTAFFAHAEAIANSLLTILFVVFFALLLLAFFASVIAGAVNWIMEDDKRDEAADAAVRRRHDVPGPGPGKSEGP